MSEKHPQKVPFINRKKEQEYLFDYFSNVSSKILFIYWPKSTGKTTLLRKVIKRLDEKKYAISYLNLREVLINDFKDFKNIFFPKDLKWKVRNIIWWVKFNLGFFWWDVDDENLLNTNIFALMIKKIKKANDKWIKPVIILDEFQYLKDIYLDDKKEVKLINELFKFFIALKKQNNMAHVVCLTSDSYFLDELYYETKLKNTSKFYLVDHLLKEDIYYWLLELEKCPKKMVDNIWNELWGSVWEIWQVFVAWKNWYWYEEGLEYIRNDSFSRAKEIYINDLKNIFPETFKEEKIKYLKIIKYIVEKSYFDILEEDIDVQKLIKILVDKDLWFYDSITGKVTANSESMRVAFRSLLEKLWK